MDPFLVVRHLPLASSLVWLAIAVSQARGGTLRVSTGAAFVATATLISLYALWDWLHVTDSMPTSMDASLPSLLVLVLASLAFLYFARWFARGRRWGDALLAVPAILLALPFMLAATPGLPPAWLEAPFILELRTELADIARFQLYATGLIVVFILAGINFLRQGALLALDVMGRESWAIIAIMGAASLVLGFAIVVLIDPFIPLIPELGSDGANLSFFSTTLLIPGVLLLASLRRGRAIGVLKLFNLRESYRGETLAVYLTHETGSLIGAAPMQGDGMDDDLFAGTFDAFQSFFNHALPFLEGHTLRTATFGEIAVIMERGQYCYLTVVTTSKRLGLIRDLMRQRLRQFETWNARHLRDWNGLVDTLMGRTTILQEFLPDDGVGERPRGPAEVAG